MEYCVEGYCLRPLCCDDFERISRYERVKRRHLQPIPTIHDRGCSSRSSYEWNRQNAKQPADNTQGKP